MTSPVAEGDVVAGKYRIERVLGRGGMGIVVAATHLQLGQRVAIKMLVGKATTDIVARFVREARAAVRLKSEHVARVLDVGELPNGSPYMVMEYLEGSDLSVLVKGHGARSVADTVEHVLHACEGIAEAHAVGIVHRDLKPANLFLTRTADGANTIKVLDFGISKAPPSDADEEAGMSLTQTSSILGSPHYMAPEQMKSARLAEARSDIWSLGAILYELLAGRVPFRAATFTELVLVANLEPPPPLSRFRADVPAGLEAAILRCLEKKPQNRFANVAELAWAIAPYGPEGARSSPERVARMLGVTRAPPAEPAVSTEPEGEFLDPDDAVTIGPHATISSAALATSTVPAPPVGRGRGIVIAVAVTAATLIGGGAALGLLRQRSSPAAPAAAPIELPAASGAVSPEPARSALAPTATVASAAAPPLPSASVLAAPNSAPAPERAPKLAKAATPPASPPPQPAPPEPAPAPRKNPLDIQLK